MKILISLLFFLSANSLTAGSLKLESGFNRNTLIELYTSEGCSSCPPAEKYLNKLKSSKKLWKTLIPVAFHVDYWDYIGWTDPYAQKSFGLRQSLYANINNSKTVYTPAFMLNGISWRRRIFSNSFPEAKTKAGNLTVLVSDKVVRANYQALTKNMSSLKLNIAVLGMELSSHIKSGENEGRTAKHDFVVVGYNSVLNSENYNLNNSNKFEWNLKLPELHYSDAKKYALAIWVSEKTNPTPLQAVGGFLTNYK